MFNSMTVKQVLRTKGHGFRGIAPGATAYEALELMAKNNIGAVLVVENAKLVGVFSERDYARKVILKGRSSKMTTVCELMSSPPITAGPELTLRECMMLMTANHIRHLPIVESGTLIGVVSIGDVVNAIITGQREQIEELENYITETEYPFPATA